MNELCRNQFVDTMNKMWLVFKSSREMPDSLIGIYWEALEGYTFDRVRLGMAWLISNQKEKIMPTPGAIIAAMPRPEELPALPDPDDGRPGITYAEYIKRGGTPFYSKKTHDKLMARPAERIKERAEKDRHREKRKPKPMSDILADVIPNTVSGYD